MSFNKALKALAKKAKKATTHNERLKLLTEMRKEFPHLNDNEWSNFVDFINKKTSGNDKSYLNKSAWQNFWDGATRFGGDIPNPKGLKPLEVLDTFYGTKYLRKELVPKAAKRLNKDKRKRIPGIAAGVAGVAAVKGMRDSRTESDTKGESRSARNRPASQNQQSVAARASTPIKDDYQPARFNLDDSDRYFSKPKNSIDYESTKADYVDPKAEKLDNTTTESKPMSPQEINSRRSRTRKSSLTPMQQWAATHTGLARKVKPNQAGYEEIQSIVKPSVAQSLLQQANAGIPNF